MRVLIVGVGGIGSFLGSYLLKGGFDLTFIARGKRYKEIKQNGLKLISDLGNIYIKNIEVLEEIKSNESFDIILNTVKLYDFDFTLKEIKEKIKGSPIILPFQNGIYAEEKLRITDYYKQIFGAVAQISVFIESNHDIKHVGKLATFFVGCYDGNSNDVLNKFCESCNNLGLDIRFKTNIKEKIWDKFIFLSAYSGFTTLEEKSIGEIFDDTNLRRKFINAMKETFELSKTFNVSFSKDPVETWLEKIEKMPYEMTSSMYLDFKNSKKLELDWLSGYIVNLGKSKKINFPTHNEIVEGIKIKQSF